MTSRSEQVAAAVVAILGNVPSIGSRVFRERFEAVARNEMPAIVVAPAAETPTINAIPRTDHSLQLQIDILINGRPLAVLADPIRCSVHQLLMADRSLGGIASNIEQGPTNWDGESGEIGVVRCSYLVRFRTLTTDLSLP